jgi:inositol phosphorylceramide mannosyltransferase catalytic subunit
MIPKVFHQIWIGPHKMPDVFQRWRETWLSLNPSWELKLWTDEGVSDFPESMKTACNLSQKSNILRWEIIAKYGGVYIDTDFECLQPIDGIIAGEKCFVAKKSRSALLMAAIFGAEAGHPLAVALRDDIPTADSALVYELGSRYLTNRWLANREGVRVFEPEVFCPVHHDDIGFVREVTDPRAYGWHHWTSVTHGDLGFRRLI